MVRPADFHLVGATKLIHFGGVDVSMFGFPVPGAEDFLPLEPPPWKGAAAVDDPFKLNRQLNLRQECADFYLLALAEALGSQEASAMLREHAFQLAEQLARYLELACLGEARHLFSTHAAQAVMDRAKGKLYKAFLEQLRADAGGISRHQLWGKWDEYFGRYGRQLHVWLVNMFGTGNWGGGVGGPKWQRCMQVPLAYRRGRLSPVAFCDAAFGLQHNNSIAYDKLWDVSYIPLMLDERRSGNYTRLYTYASGRVRQLAEVVGVPKKES